MRNALWICNVMGWDPLPELDLTSTLENLCAPSGDAWKVELRKAFVRAVAGGLSPGSALARRFFASHFCMLLPNLLHRARLYSEPSKVSRWVLQGGRKRGADSITPQRVKENVRMRIS